MSAGGKELTNLRAWQTQSKQEDRKVEQGLRCGMRDQSRDARWSCCNGFEPISGSCDTASIFFTFLLFLLSKV